MKKIRMCVDTDKTFAEGFEEYILDCKSRNLRDGTLRHYRESIKQIYKRVPPDTLISDLDEYTMPDFIVALRDDPNLNDVSMETYARDLKTLMRFFMKCEYLPHFEIKIPKADKEAIETYTDAELKRLLKKPDINAVFPQMFLDGLGAGSVVIVCVFQKILPHQQGFELLAGAFAALVAIWYR